jgi:hypothetical protein
MEKPDGKLLEMLLKGLVSATFISLVIRDDIQHRTSSICWPA